MSEQKKMEAGFRDLDRGDALLEAGLTAEAAEAFKSAARSGVAHAYVRLASIEIERDNWEAARSYMREAERLAEGGDALANLSCSLAYQIGYGEGSPDEDEEKARYFLRRAAELGDPVAQCLLAHQFLYGLNGDVQDEGQYEKWIWRAIDQDLEDAIISHVENMLNWRREIEPRLLTKLEDLAASSERARKLLRKAARRRK